MANDSDQIVEEIVLDLKTNWDSELRNTLRKMNQFKDQVADISKSAVNSYGNFQKQFLSEFGSMSKNTVGEMRVLIGATRRELGELQRLNDSFVKSQEEAATKIERMSKAALTRTATSMKGIVSSQESRKEEMRAEWRAKGRIPSWKKLGEVDAETSGMLEDLKAKYVKTTEKIKSDAFAPLYLESVKLHAKLSDTIESAAQKSLRSVTATVQDVFKQYEKVKNLISPGGMEGKLVTRSEFLSSAKSQFKSADTTLKAQQARMKEIEGLRKTAEDMLMRVRKEDIEAVKNYLKGIVTEQMAAKNAMEATAKQTMTLKDIIKSATQDAILSGKQIQQSIKTSLGPMKEDIRRGASGAFKSLSQMVVASTKQDQGGFIKASDNVDKYIRKLDDAEAKLNEIKSQLKAVAGTGFIDENVIKSASRQIEEGLNKIKQNRKEIAASVKDFNALNMQKMMQKTDASGFIKSATEFAKVKSEYSGLGPITPQNYMQAEGYIKKMVSSYEAFAKQKQIIDNQMLENTKYIASIESAMRRTKDNDMKTHYAEAIEAMKKKNKELADLKAIAATSPAMKPADTKAEHAKVVAQAKQIAADIQKSVKPEGWLNSGVDQLRKDLEKLQETTAKLGRFSLLKDYKKDGIEMYESLKSRAKAYTNEIVNIGKQIVELKRIQKSGLGDSESIGKTISKLQEMQKQFRYANQEISRINNQASKSHQQLTDHTSKGIWKSGIEMVRNFRWQYAAVYYILQNIIGRIVGFVKGTMDEIGQFQKDALSLAAVISMRMFGSIEENFSKAYQVSKGLMDKLNLVATETVLTLEDMTMLTKTFVQAGIIPETTEDVRKIAAIGVAVKAVTEGMANAGTQMRQELNAVILGRQRASDQLAMMFKFMGINLKKVLKDAQDEGRNLLDVLSEALAPFQAMNKAMQDNWLQASNRASEVWKIIKRIGAEDFTATMTKKLNTFLDSVINNKGELTSFGKELAAGFGAIMNTLGTIFTSVLGVVKDILSVISMITTSIFGTTKGMEGLSGGLRDVLNSAKLVMWIFVTLENLVSMIVSGLKVITSFAARPTSRMDPSIKDMKDFFDPSKNFGELGTGQNVFNKALEDYNKNSKLAEDRMKNIDNVIADIVKKLKDASSESVDLGDVFKLPHDPIALMDRWQKNTDDMKRARLAGLKGPQKFAEEYDIDIKNLGRAKEQLAENLEYYNKYFDDIESGAKKYGAAQYKRFQEEAKGTKEMLEDENKLRQYLLDKRNKQTADWYHTEGDRLARLAEEWEGFLISTAEAPISEWQKLDKWIEETQKKMRKMRVTNTEKYNEGAAQDALTKGIENRAKKITEESEKAQKDLMEKISSYKFKSPFQQIDLEADKMRNDVDEFMRKFSTLDDHTNRMVEHWGELIIEMGKAKRELAHLDLLQQNFNSKMDLASRQVNYWKDAYDPATVRLANINSILIEQSKAVGDIAIAYRKVDIQIREMQQAGATEGIDSYIEMRENYVKQLEIIKLETEKLVWKDLHPLWAELTEMSKSWGDGMTEAFADIVDGSKKAGIAINDLLKTVQRDVLKATIKNTITEPIMGFMGGSGTPGEVSPLAKLLGAQGEGAAGSMKKVMEGVKAENEKLMTKFLMGYTIIPVQIVGNTDAIRSASEEANQSVVDMMKANKDSVDATKQTLDDGFSKEFALLQQMILKAATGGGSSGGLIGGAVDLGKGLFDKIGGMFGTETGVTTNSTNSWTQWAGKTGGWGAGEAAAESSILDTIMNSGMIAAFAEGGTIKEPIVGQGLKSGGIYAFGEKTPYGQNEVVAPMDKLAKIASSNGGGGQHISLSMPISVQAIDTQSGVDFLMKHNGTIENSMIKMVRNNRRIRDAFRAS